MRLLRSNRNVIPVRFTLKNRNSHMPWSPVISSLRRRSGLLLAVTALLSITFVIPGLSGQLNSVNAQSAPPAGATARWTLVETEINPENLPLVVERFIPILEPRPDGRPHIDRDVTDTFEK